MACRRVESGEEEAKSFKGLKGSYEVIKCDLADLDSVREFVNQFKSKHDRLDGLDCNAGNPALCDYYEKQGFKQVGVRVFEDFSCNLDQ